MNDKNFIEELRQKREEYGVTQRKLAVACGISSTYLNQIENGIAVPSAELKQTMEKQLVMPKLQPEMQSGVLCAWLKNEGEEIHKGEALYEIETDKVVNQIEATEDGILRRQLCEEGDSVAVLTPVAIVET